MKSQVNLILPYVSCRNHAYIYDLSKIPSQPSLEDYAKGVRCGFNVDAEFKEHPTAVTILDSQVKPRQGVTCQISGILDAPAMIFAHPDHEIYAASHNPPLVLRHPVFRSGALFIDYLQALGENISIRRCDRTSLIDKLPRFEVDLFAFFALAENTMVFTGEYKEEMRQLAIQGCITQQRRLTSRDIVGPDNWQLDYVRLGAIVTWNGLDYGLQVRWIDVCALHGVASYRDLLVNAGLPTDDKDLMKELGMIERMDEAYFLYPEEYDTYALGDLHIYKALLKNNENFERIHHALGLPPKPPHLTIGRTIATMFEGSVLTQFGVDPDDTDWKKDTLHKACYYGNAEYFRKRTTQTSAVISKVVGGRVGAHRILLASLDAPWADMDLAACYASILRTQQYVFGRPMLTEYEVDSEINNHDTLRQWLKKRGYWTERNELVPSLWLAYVSLRPNYTLKYPQTFFASWFGFNAKGRNITLPPPDEWIIDLQEDKFELAVDSGNVKILTHRIEYAALGQHGLEWILYGCDTTQRNELLDNLYVMSAAYYKRSDRVPTIAALQEVWNNPQGENTCQDIMLPDKQGKLVSTQLKKGQECYK